MDEYEYISYRLGLMESNSIRHKRNEKNDLLLKVLTSHNLGGVIKTSYPLGLPTKNPYGDVLSNILHFRENRNEIPLYEVMLYEHLLIFGIHHTSKNQYKWLNLVNNFELILKENCYEDCKKIQDELTELYSPLSGMSIDEFDNSFCEFYGRVLNSHYSTSGYRLSINKNLIITSYKGKVICLFPKKDPHINIRNTIKVISKFHGCQNKKGDVTSQIDLIFYW